MAVAAWVQDATGTFGHACKTKLAGPGDAEAAIRSPLEALLQVAGDRLSVRAVFHDEVRDSERQVRPDYALAVDGAITGYVEVKAPGRSIDPTTFRGHDLRQWERQRDLPNLLYTNGTEWRLYRDSEPYGDPVTLTGGTLHKAGRKLRAADDFEVLLTAFLRWTPAPITSVKALVRAVAPLTRLLRGEVFDQFHAEKRRIKAGAHLDDQPFHGLARDWRALLFPHDDNEKFADGYAQTVTFALLLARSEGIDLSESLHTIGERLSTDHSLMGSALQLLTDHVAADFRVTLDLLVRLVAAVRWDKIRSGNRDTYLYLYEHFLEAYDPALRQKSGSYYTPRPVVEDMVRLTEEALTTHLNTAGFADPAVVTVDPAMGTGTYLHTIIERVANTAREAEGPGIVAATISDLAQRLVGFEVQMGPYAVAELRTADLLRDSGAKAPADGMHLFVTDTLDDPHVEVTQLGYGLNAIAASRRRANKVKAKTPVTVVIGNPPYHERAEGQGGWVEMGDAATGVPAPLNDFRAPGNGAAEFKLKNSYVYFWRWATWKVFDDPQRPTGVVCFISTSGYLRGPGFKGMREYLRRNASHGWIVDLTPEGQRSDVSSRIFPGVQQPLAIGLFIRTANSDPATPAHVRYTSIAGTQDEKFQLLKALSLKGSTWRDTRTTWQAPFTPAAVSAWDDYPALEDLLPWRSTGMTTNRAWVYAPSPQVLEQRWQQLLGETDPERQRLLFKETRDSSLVKKKAPLPGGDVAQFVDALRHDHGGVLAVVKVGYRSFDRQYVVADPRTGDYLRPDLWAARSDNQVFVVEQHSKVLPEASPGVVFSALIPDADHFKGSEGGRTLPMLHPDGSANLAPGLLRELSCTLGVDVEVQDVVAYLAGIAAHSGYSTTFQDELTTPGVRIPLTADPALWGEAVELGRQVVWAQTYGARWADAKAGRPRGKVRYPAKDSRQPQYTRAVQDMPATMTYDPDRQVLTLGTGEWSNVTARVADYAVGGKNVVKSWFNYRKAIPGGKKTSPLDDVHLTQWPKEWSIDLTDLLTVLTRLVELEDAQAVLLEKILDGPTLSMNDLGAAGVSWPTTKEDRQPRRALNTVDTLPGL